MRTCSVTRRWTRQLVCSDQTCEVRLYSVSTVHLRCRKRPQLCCDSCTQLHDRDPSGRSYGPFSVPRRCVLTEICFSRDEKQRRRRSSATNDVRRRRGLRPKFPLRNVEKVESVPEKVIVEIVKGRQTAGANSVSLVRLHLFAVLVRVTKSESHAPPCPLFPPLANPTSLSLLVRQRTRFTVHHRRMTRLGTVRRAEIGMCNVVLQRDRSHC